MALRPHVGTSIMETYMFILLILSLESVLRLRVELPKSLGPEPPLYQSLSIVHGLVMSTCDYSESIGP